MFPRASVQTEMFVQKSNINLNTPLSLPLLGETLILALCLLLTVLIPATSIAQQTAPIGDPFENYLRILQADTTVDQSNRSSLFIRPGSIPNTQYSIPNTHPWSDHPFFTRTENFYATGPVSYDIFTPRITHSYNTQFPGGQNDGALWQGRGHNTHYSLGGKISYGPIELAFRPEFGYITNREFEMYPNPPFFTYPVELNEFAQGLSRHDAPQRFGEDSFTWFHPGQSYLRGHYGGAAAGISTGNMWTGPALYNPLTLSNNAPGFFHAFLETDGPVSTPIGSFEGKIFWGGLQESDYFDDDPTNDLRFINGLVFSYSPSFLPTFDIGFSRTMYEYYPDDGLSFRNLTRVFQPFTEDRFAIEHEYQLSNESNPRTITADKAVHMFTIFGRWLVPDRGFEAWFEWGFNENSFDQRDLLTERVHTRSYVIGFQKRFDISPRHWTTWDFEMTHLENLENTTANTYPIWYESLVVNQGFTHDGQILGAGIGPGSSSLKTNFSYYNRFGKIGASANRIVHQNDRLYRYFDHIRRNQDRVLRDHWDHDLPQYANLYDLFYTEYRFGGHLLAFLPYNFELQADIHVSYFMNKYNIYDNDFRSINSMVTLRYQLDGLLR